MDFQKDIKKSLQTNKKKILDQWFDATIKTYPSETARVLGRIKNKFDNPVGAATHESLEAVFEEILKEMDPTALEDAIDPIIRIRAVQNFTPASAVGFVFDLKEIAKKIMAPELHETFDRRVDTIALAAFNRYMRCREAIFLIKATEAKKRIHSAFERAGLVTELKEKELF
ncbi:conserved hypothetical protein [Desulforapulum autotrophicum HRM2]|uniref:RsbT co-antagonist protein RsbRD N-terminal domain-containing protein n=1 Tax=Desulforapulum autotrophicum (strain ATCC 43914 / DSM 3382 / VKM B-1955 / HRM2) TaxID=177437 RepID=C0QL04_DESAH|nr:RsbRD N-terminal domain-containing protein [Desulforapulum autotrophicum]ACN16244.1 conserved hypothetical protein [Desulforapulum autotrophicum HRM2]